MRERFGLRETTRLVHNLFGPYQQEALARAALRTHGR